MAMLRYSIADEMLYGTVNGVNISTKAFSGGGRGSTAGAEQIDVAHWSTSKKAPETFNLKNRGGPIPVGFYRAEYVSNHRKFGKCIRLHHTLTSLIQVDVTSPTGVKYSDRDGFLIHGEGPKGSDGCIVPANKEAFKLVLSAINNSTESVHLEVHTEGIRIDKVEGKKQVGNIA